MIAGGCAEARLSLGAYVLGALDPAERGRVDVHLGECADCRDELASFAGLPGLLGRVSIAEVELVPEPAAPELLDRVLVAVGNERRRNRLVRRLSAVAAGVIVVAASAVAGVAVASSGQPQQPATQTAASTTVTATDPVTHVTASVVEWPKKWGAGLQVELATGQINAYGGGHIETCQLVAVGADGTRDIAASWSATATSKVVAEGATALPVSAITAFDIVGSDGSTLVTIPNHAVSG